MSNNVYLFLLYFAFLFDIIPAEQKNLRIDDKLYKIRRLFVSGGIILEPTVFINNQYLFRNDNSSVFGGFKIGIDIINSIFSGKRFGFINKNKLFFSKLMDMDVYKRPKLKDDFMDFIFGFQFEIGLSIILNKDYKKIGFNDKNKINTCINSLNFLVGLKEELGKINDILKAKMVFPTKIIAEIMYILDLKHGFSFYLSVIFFQCFSPIYLLSCNRNDFCNTFNNHNFFNWNINIEIGLLGLNFFI